jgi:hypothetical protein
MLAIGVAVVGVIVPWRWWSMPSPERAGRRRASAPVLAWQRSAFGFVALAGVVLSVAAHREAPGLLVLSAALVAVAVAVWRQGLRVYTAPTCRRNTRARVRRARHRAGRARGRRRRHRPPVGGAHPTAAECRQPHP